MGKRHLFFGIFFIWAFVALAQSGQPDNGNGQSVGLINTNNNLPSGEASSEKKFDRPPITEYHIISVENDTTFVDTSLTIRKFYKWNYLRKDTFELLPFNNVGQPYTKLGYDFDNLHITPEFGARAKHYNHYEVEDVSYYNVATPFTELFYKTVLEQGNNLDALFTTNTSPQFNFFAAYKGTRSIGKYQNSVSSVGNVRLGFSYNTKDRRYFIKTHFVAQDFSTEENGGLTSEAKEQYVAKIDEFEDRSLLDVNFNDAESFMDSRRFYLEHKYNITKPREVVSGSTLSVGHILNFKDKELEFTQGTSSNLLGSAFEDSNLSDLTEYQDVYNELNLSYSNTKLGKLTFKTSYTDFNYGYNRTVDFENSFVTNRLTGNIINVGADYTHTLGKLSIKGTALASVSGDRTGNYINGYAEYTINEDISLVGELSTNEHAPNFNFLLFQSDYINYNWQNDFKNESEQHIEFKVLSNKYGRLEIDNTTINNYAYFRLGLDSLVRPEQYQNTVNYLKIKLDNDFDLGYFGIASTILYQNVSSGDDVFRVPEFVTRQSIYYQDYWFKKALYLQTGITGKYFTGYLANGYDPVLSDFFVQNNHKIDGFPSFDVFFNAKIRQARVFLTLENAETIVLGNNNFSAPSHPYRDFVVRFGLVWDFFL